MWRFLLVILLLQFAVKAQLSFAEEPSEDTKKAARDLLDQGDAQRAKGELEQALRSYEAADKLMAVPTTRIEVARTLAQLGRLIEAQAAAERVLALASTPSEPHPFSVARAEATSLISALEQEIPGITLTVDGPPKAKVRLLLDGEPTAFQTLIRINPGAHTVSAEAPGFLTNKIAFEIGRGERRPILVRLVRVDSGATAGARVIDSPIFWSGAVGAASGLGLGAGFGVASLSIASDVESACEGFTDCPSHLEDEAEQSLTFANISNVAFGLAGASAVVMIVGLVVAVTDTSADLALTKDGVTFSF